MGVLSVAVFILMIYAVLGTPSTRPCNLQTNTCLYDPCLLQSCEKFPQAQCRDYKCGGVCQKEFWYNGVNVTDQCAAPKSDFFTSIFNSVSGGGGSNNGGTGSNTVNDGNTGVSSGCPAGLQQVACFMEPCSVSSCPGVPTATCKNNYCGGCIADYYQGTQKVTDRCSANNLCPNGQPPSTCAASPCSTAKCLRYPSATCQDDYCGGCNAKFFVGKEDVTSKCPEKDHGCPPGEPYTTCTYSPCRVSSCLRYPNAACVDYHCGGCIAKFYYYGQEVTTACRQRPQPQRRRMPSWYYWMFGDGMF